MLTHEAGLKNQNLGIWAECIIGLFPDADSQDAVKFFKNTPSCQKFYYISLGRNKVFELEGKAKQAFILHLNGN